MGGHKKKHSHKNKHEGGNALFENPAAMRFLRYYSPETFWYEELEKLILGILEEIIEYP